MEETHSGQLWELQKGFFFFSKLKKTSNAIKMSIYKEEIYQKDLI